MHQTSSKHTFTSRHGRISNRSPNQKDIAGKNRADSNTNRAGKSGQEAERVDKPRHAKPTDIRRGERANMQCLAHPLDRDSVTRQEIQEIKPHISRIRAIRWGSLATEREMRDAAPAAFHTGVPPSSMRRFPSDANLAIRTRTEPEQRQGVPRHRVTKRKVAREDTKEGVHNRSRKLQERHQVGAHGKGATKRVKMLGRARATPLAAGRDVIGSGLGSDGALPGERRLRAHMPAEVAIQRRGGRERLWQTQRGAADSLGPRMVGRHRSMSNGSKMQAVWDVRTLRCSLQTCRISQMSEVARALARKHLTDSKKNCGGYTRTPSPSSLPAKTADPAGQETGRQKKVVKELEWGTGRQPPRLRFRSVDPSGGPQASMPYSRTGRMIRF
jgi:hypothetical protein